MANQRCTWRLGTYSSTLTGSLEHDLATYDALHITTRDSRPGDLPEIVGAKTKSPFSLTGFLAPVTLTFNSDHVQQARGFIATWEFQRRYGEVSTSFALEPEAPPQDGQLGVFDGDDLIWVWAIVLTSGLVLILFLVGCGCSRHCRRRVEFNWANDIRLGDVMRPSPLGRSAASHTRATPTKGF